MCFGRIAAEYLQFKCDRVAVIFFVSYRYGWSRELC